MTDTHVHAPPNTETEPQGELCIRTLAMPADTNGNGDIFGGWLLSQMDIAGGVFTAKVTKSRNVTVAIEAMNFRKPVNVGDLVSVYGKLVRIGHMGDQSPFDMLIAVSALELALKFVGMEVRMGAGVAAVQARIAKSV